MKPNHHTPDPHAALLRKVPQEYWGDMREHILQAARRAGTYVTVLEGRFTDKVYIVLHDGPNPRKKLLAHYAAEELAAAQTEGGMQ